MSNPKNTRLRAVELDHPVNKAVTVETVQVSPAVAARMLEHNLKNRNLRQKVVSRYARDMSAGDWQMSAEPIKFDWNGRLIDGQHRLHAIIESSATIPMMVVRGLDPDAQTVLDAGAKRSASDALRFHGEDRYAPILAGMARISHMWDAGELKSAASSPSTRATTSEIISWVEQNPDARDGAAIGSKHAPKIGLKPSPLGFAAMKFIRLSPSDAIEFISSMSEMRTSGARDPRLALIQKVRRMTDDGARLTYAVQLNLLFRAWNAWRSGKGLSALRLNNSDGSSVAIPEPK